MTAHNTPEACWTSPAAIRDQVARIARSTELAKSGQLIRFLNHVVERTLAGQADDLKEYTIAIEVFGRPETHDPRVDPIVRTEARRLRARLEQYYTTHGLFDPIIIELPKGGYVPVFVTRESGPYRAVPAVGQVFSHYRLLEILGESEADIVYKAEDTHLSRAVVLRLLSPVAVSGLRRDELERFAGLEHPNCSTFLEMDEFDGHTFVVSSYVEGPTLRLLVEKGPLPLAEALRIADELSLGLWAAHRRGVVHRNLNPSNIAIGPNGEVKILDLGLGRLKKNTSEYLAPEQIRGELGDQYSDIWSVGVNLYQMVSGTRPFQGESPELLRQAILHERPAPLPALGAGPAAALESVVQKCLEKLPADRYSDISELGTELRRIRTELVEPKLQPASAAFERKRNGTWIWVAGVAMALAALAGVLTISSWWKTIPATTPLEPSIAVLPFDDLTPGGGSQALAGAISESLMGTLSKLRGFRVVSRTSAEAVKHRRMSAEEIATRLKVEYLLQGSLIKARDNLRVTIQMIRASDDTHLWSDRYDFPEAEIFKVVGQVSERVVRQVRMRIDPIAERAVKSREFSINPAAYNEYTQGRYEALLFQNTLRPEHATRAEGHLRRAIELAPQVVPYSVALAELWQSQLYPAPPNRADLIRGIREILTRAVQIEPQNAQAQYLMGYSEMLDGNTRKALELTRSAVELEPGNPNTYYQLAQVYGALGFYESALYTFEEAISRDVLYLNAYLQKTHYLSKLNRLPEARQVLKEVREFDLTGLVSGLITSEICHHEGNSHQCAETWKSLELRSGASSMVVRSTVDLELALVNASKGDFSQGRSFIKNVEDLRHRRRDHGILLAAALGEKELTLSLIRESPFFNSYRWLAGERLLEKWRGDAEYQKLAKELYQKWQRDLSELRHSLPVAPPSLQAPD